MPVSAEDEWTFWDGKATDLRRNQLATVQTSATKWSGMLTALLGVFGTVAFAGGLTTIDKLADPYPLVVKIMTTGAALGAIAGIYTLTRAAGGLSLTKTSAIDAGSVRDMYTTNAKESLRWLRQGKICALLAALLVLGGSGFVLWSGEAAAHPKAPSVVGIVSGRAICGKLHRARDGVISIGDATGKVTGLISVEACP